MQPPSAGADPAASSDGTSPQFGLQEEYAYAEAVRAYAAGFPWLFMATLRHLWTTVPQSPGHVPYAALNRFWHMRQLAGPTLRDGALPSNDTPYSVAWLDLAAGPVILGHGDMGGRFFGFDLLDMGLGRIASVGSALTGPAAGAFAIRGPDWRGRLPAGIAALPRAPSPSVLLVGRTEGHGPTDLPAVHAAQDAYRLMPLAAWPDSSLPPERRAVLEPIPPSADPLGDWKTINGAMTADPPRRSGVPAEGWAHLGVGPGLLVEAQSEATRRGLARAGVRGRRGLVGGGWPAPSVAAGGWTALPSPADAPAAVSPHARWQAAVASALGWSHGSRRRALGPSREDLGGLLPPARGRAGLELAAMLACAPEHAPAVYTVAADASGARLIGGRAYRLRFAPDRLPPARWFWSLTLYGSDRNLCAGTAGPSSVGDRSPGFVRDADGGVTIAIGPTPAAGDVTWLASPPERRSIMLVLRLHAGDRAAAEAWRPPAVEEVRAGG